LRTLWPDEFQQLYTPEEMGESDMFKSAEVVTKSQAEGLNDKIKSDAPPEKKDNLYETKEPEKKEEKDPIRAAYINLGDKNFRKWVMEHLDYIPKLDQKYQDEIQSKWARRFGLAEDYPVKEVEPEAAPDEDEPPQESEPDTETGLMLKYADQAKLTQSGVAVYCPNNPKGISALRTKCDGIGMEVCKSRVGCPTWATYDEVKKASE